MPRWDPTQMWKDEDVYIIGGGDSLKMFDWDLIRGRKTIGCNSAYILGVEIVKIVIFGDFMWWKNIGERGGTFKGKVVPGTSSYGGLVVGCCPRLHDDPCPWLLKMDRHDRQGLDKTKLGFNGNTGSLAISLALILGARRVLLLGFDMKMGPNNNPNWHDVRYEAANAQSYPHFCRELKYVARDLPLLYPGVEIWNVTDDSNLECFPKVAIKEHFK